MLCARCEQFERQTGTDKTLNLKHRLRNTCSALGREQEENQNVLRRKLEEH